MFNQILKIKIINDKYPIYKCFCRYRTSSEEGIKYLPFRVLPEMDMIEPFKKRIVGPRYRYRSLRVLSMTRLAENNDVSVKIDSCYNPDDTVEKDKPKATKIDKKKEEEKRIKTMKDYKFHTEIHLPHECLKTHSDFMNCVNSPEIDTPRPIQGKGDLKSPAMLVGQTPRFQKNVYRENWNQQYAASFHYSKLDNVGIAKGKTFREDRYDEKKRFSQHE